MKKNILLFLFIITIFLLFFYRQSISQYKVFKIESPTRIFIDTNKNLIFDETEPFIIKNIKTLDKDSNLEAYPILNEITNQQKRYIEFQTKKLSNKLLMNKFITIKNNEIFVNNKKYSQILLDEKLAFNDNIETQKKLLNYIKSINIDEYVFYNQKTKKFYALCTENKINFNDYKLVHISKIQNLSKYKNLYLNSEQTKIYKNHEKTTKEDLSTFKISNLNIFFQDINRINKPINECNSLACKTLKKEIDNSNQSIDFAIYGINNQPEIIVALVNAKKRGVKIRWVCDFDKKNNNYYPDTEKLKKYINSYKTDEEYDKKNPQAIMHNKFFIFDEKKVWTGSANITNTDLTDFNANYSILIQSQQIARIYKKEFEQMYYGNFHTHKKQIKKTIINFDKNTKIKILFSPQDKIIDNDIIPIILNAKKYIYIPIFFITHKEIENALIRAKRKGVEIKIINDATNAHSKYTIHKRLRKENIKVKTENYAGKMHIKGMFVDDEISIIGSMNFTKSANNKNDENIIIIYNKEITKYFRKTFIYLWKKIPSKYEYFDPRAESIESIGSCNDGIDNNFDGKIDADDIGCQIKN